jgi:glycosyltransferase A (GT-A) superfamily protein (DUF2064 family)
MPAGIAIFVKTPGLSPLKTRLAATLGRAAAERWYALAATAVAEVCARASDRTGAPLYWAVAESHGLADHRWTGLPRLAQGPGDLGTRMANIHGLLVARHGGGMLLGADTPQIDAAEIEAALAWIANPDPRAMFGPAGDGGFWLYAGNRKLSDQTWQAPAYSSPNALAGLRDGHPRTTVVKLIGVHRDVDTEADLAPCVAALAQLADPTPAQRALLALMRGAEAAD